MKRLIVKVSAHYNPGSEKSRFVGGSNHLTLECGHEVRQKMSRPIPGRTWCRRCDNLRTGNGVYTAFDIRLKIARFETWDAVRLLPVKQERPMTHQELECWCNSQPAAGSSRKEAA
jgi:hypothetical protein